MLQNVESSIDLSIGFVKVQQGRGPLHGAGRLWEIPGKGGDRTALLGE